MNPYQNLPSDTPDHVMEMQIAIILQKTLSERLNMCGDITDFSYNMLKRQIIERDKNISEGMLKFEIVCALYADCFDEEELNRIKAHFIQPNAAV